MNLKDIEAEVSVAQSSSDPTDHTKWVTSFSAGHLCPTVGLTSLSSSPELPHLSTPVPGSGVYLHLGFCSGPASHGPGGDQALTGAPGRVRQALSEPLGL